MCTKLIDDISTKLYSPLAKTTDSRSYYGEYLHSEKDLKKPDLGTITCPHCYNEVILVPYGGGWVGVCCRTIVYNEINLPNTVVE
jgi:hypothetical protein